MKIDIEKLRLYEKAKTLHCQKHPNADMYIWAYTPMVQFSKMWDPVTLMCRGLITDGEGNILSRPFGKFFNLSEHQGELPKGDFKLYEKMDGSIGILYWQDGNPYIANRRSFINEQARKGTDLLQKYKEHFDKIDKTKTYVFEVIYPENRIVLDYEGQEKLVLLAVIDLETGKEEDIYDEKYSFFEHKPTLHPAKELKDIANENVENREGYVIAWTLEDGRVFRLKFKFEEYKRLHALVTNTSSLTIWELIRSRTPLETVLDKVPDEFYSFVRDVAKKIMDDYRRINDNAVAALNTIKLSKKPKTRAEWAKYITKASYPHILFKLLDQKSAYDEIMKIVKPEQQKPFRDDV